MHALICDDDRSTRLVVRSLVERKLGWTAAECADGAFALQMLVREHFDVAILDINMPNLDGVSVVRAIRRSPKLRDLPIVMLTADSREAMVRDLLALGVSDYIVKPLNAQTAIAKLALIRGSGDVSQD
jgi:two-component system chemotaxis response regulator CheY